ncbi:acetyltransferase [Vibrio sinaloensis]|uniref:acetyltransferase n=1 Tax=Photobacterium sp. (strain ATCC 43367) TaxID=379097 RepID=UPI002F4022D3
MSDVNQDCPIVVIGGGGHASVLVDMLKCQGRDILAVVSPDELSGRSSFAGLLHLRNDEDVLQFSHEDVRLVVGLGILPGSDLKERVTKFFAEQGYEFETVISDHAYVSPFAKLSSGVQVLANAVVNAGVVIGSHSIINSGAVVEHDSDIGQYNHIAPGAIICGQVKSGRNVFFGAGSVVVQNTCLARNSIVGAGATVTRSLRENETCYPSRSTTKHQK